MLAKDLFTIYCGLSDLEERNDSNYYQRCFMYIVKNVYNNQENILNHKASDLAFNYSIYVNLLRSNAFLYTPIIYGEESPECYREKDSCPLIYSPPDPTKHTLFNITPIPDIIPDISKIELKEDVDTKEE